MVKKKRRIREKILKEYKKNIGKSETKERKRKGILSTADNFKDYETILGGSK